MSRSGSLARPSARVDGRQEEEDAVEILFTVITIDTFWRTLLFVHFLLALALLAAVTLQAAAVLMPARQAAGQIAGTVIIDRNPVPAQSYATLVVVLYVLQALMGAWIYIKYRTYVRIPLEELHQWWTVGSFEFKEHVVAMGLGLLPAYWHLWRHPTAGHARLRRLVTIFLALSVWYSFVVGHVANDFRGVGS
jgi:hypothetical protein